MEGRGQIFIYICVDVTNVLPLIKKLLKRAVSLQSKLSKSLEVSICSNMQCSKSKPVAKGGGDWVQAP